MTRLGELNMTGVVDMVAKVLAFLANYTLPPPNCCVLHATSGIPLAATPGAGTTKMSKLNVLDHGNRLGLEIGKDMVTTGSFASFKSEFVKLTPKFETDAYVHLQHCKAGTNIRLMQMFADAFGVPVVGGRGLTTLVYRANTGNYVRVHPLRGGSRPAHDTFLWGPSDQ